MLFWAVFFFFFFLLWVFLVLVCCFFFVAVLAFLGVFWWFFVVRWGVFWLCGWGGLGFLGCGTLSWSLFPYLTFFTVQLDVRV